jgi:hypothetical protein
VKRSIAPKAVCPLCGRQMRRRRRSVQWRDRCLHCGTKRTRALIEIRHADSPVAFNAWLGLFFKLGYVGLAKHAKAQGVLFAPAPQPPITKGA